MVKKSLFVIVILGFIFGCNSQSSIKKLNCIVLNSNGYGEHDKGDSITYFINIDTGTVYEKSKSSGKLKSINGLTRDDLMNYDTKSSINDNIWKEEMILTNRFDEKDFPFKSTMEVDLNTLLFKEKQFIYREGAWEETTYTDGNCKLENTSLTIEKITD